MRLIDADELIYDMKKQSYMDSQPRAIQRAIKMVANAPTVETYTKDDLTREYLKGYNDCKDMNGRSQGDWIMEENNKDYPDGRATCSHCGYKMDVKRWEWLPAVRWYLKPNYCPECGADMRKRSDE